MRICMKTWYLNWHIPFKSSLMVSSENCDDIYSSLLSSLFVVECFELVLSDQITSYLNLNFPSLPPSSSQKKKDGFTSLDRIHWASHNICHPVVSSFTRFCVRFIVNNTERLEVIYPWEKQRNVLWIRDPFFMFAFQSLSSILNDIETGNEISDDNNFPI